MSKKYTTLTLRFVLAACEAIFKAVFLELFFFSPSKKIHFYYFASSLKLTLLPHSSLVCYYFYFSLFLPHIALFIYFLLLFVCLPRSHTRSLKSTSRNFQKLYIFLLLSLSLTRPCIYAKESEIYSCRQNVFDLDSFFTALRVVSLVYFA